MNDRFEKTEMEAELTEMEVIEMEVNGLIEHQRYSWGLMKQGDRHGRGGG